MKSFSLLSITKSLGANKTFLQSPDNNYKVFDFGMFSAAYCRVIILLIYTCNCRMYK